MAVPPPSPEPPIAERAALRRALRAARRAFAGDASAIVGRLAPLLRQGGPIAGYLAHGGEPDILPFLFRACHAGHAVALPCVRDDGMTFVRWHPDAAVRSGFAGIAEPAGGETLHPAIVLTPLLGFDRGGGRLGQGGGHYDRWFATHPGARRIGIAWSIQEVPALPVAPWDQPLHAIVTEQEWITP